MKGDWTAIGPEGLAFFGRMSASISHELKNVLAIVSETSGLMGDLMEMHREGDGEINHDRFEQMFERVRKQIKRGDAIIKNMNRFAHSIDDPVARTDLAEVCDLMSRLSQRFASQKGVTLTHESPGPAEAVTSPFLVENLLNLGLEAVMDNPGQDKAVSLKAEPRDQGAVLVLRGGSAPRDFPGPMGAAIAEALNAEVTAGDDGVDIVLPASIQG
jgi:C4-dicarboxylate-specific signal transduction histidine kinase